MLKRVPYLFAVIIGVLYGVICQIAVRLHMLKDLYAVMSFGFVFILPFVLGFLTLWFATPEQRKSWLFRIFAPYGSILVCLLVSVLVGWEGAICLIMATVIYLPIGSLGGIITGLVLSKIDQKRINSSWLALVLSLPLFSAYIEHHFDLPIQIRNANTEITINASPEIVWKNIIRVPPITEPLKGYFYKMGFPKPIEASLSKEGVGGVRHASFEGELVFVETVDIWEPNKKISFSIMTDPESIPLTTLDPHVMVGGRYFDVLRGTYEIVSLSNDKCVLKLSSNITISTRFNFYAGFWANFLMSDIQNTILEVIKMRAERDMRETAKIG